MPNFPIQTNNSNVKLPFLPAGGTDTLKKQSLEFPDSQRLQRTEFNQLFKNELNKLKFSGHAISRVESRQLDINPADMERLNSAYQIAENKGVKNPMVILDDKAFIVNVPNKTVITVLDKKNLDQNIITNIDSAIFV